MDYAVLFWLRHLEVGATLQIKAEEEEQKEALMVELAESLEMFIDQHWNSPTTALNLAKRHSDKIHYFKALPFYDRLEQAVASTQRQLKHFSNMKKEEIALNIENSVCNVRNAIEELASNELEPTIQQIIIDRYGNNLYKCPQFSCQFFTVGFSLDKERMKHISKHERPFRCPDEHCVSGYAFGFSSTAEREKHMKANHLELIHQDEEFPTEQEVRQSVQNNETARSAIQAPNPQGRGNIIEETTAARTEQRESEPESEAEPQYRRPEKRARQTEFKCDHCHRIFKKRYNLQSHLRSHESTRSHVCSVCHKGFAREGDLTRHMKTHTGEKRFPCGGTLRNGSPWGCGRSFARADTLNKHHESRVGRACIAPLRQEGESGYMSTSV
ncbi:DNA-dependent ATPase fun30 [Pestalotiopsis sp. IQ-011]